MPGDSDCLVIIWIASFKQILEQKLIKYLIAILIKPN